MSMIIVMVVGSIIVFMGLNNLYLFLIGILIITLGNFMILLKKYKTGF